jgi:hypothetical protein
MIGPQAEETKDEETWKTPRPGAFWAAFRAGLVPVSGSSIRSTAVAYRPITSESHRFNTGI